MISQTLKKEGWKISLLDLGAGIVVFYDVLSYHDVFHDESNTALDAVLFIFIFYEYDKKTKNSK